MKKIFLLSLFSTFSVSMVSASEPKNQSDDLSSYGERVEKFITNQEKLKHHYENSKLKTERLEKKKEKKFSKIYKEAEKYFDPKTNEVPPTTNEYKVNPIHNVQARLQKQIQKRKEDPSEIQKRENLQLKKREESNERLIKKLLSCSEMLKNEREEAVERLSIADENYKKYIKDMQELELEGQKIKKDRADRLLILPLANSLVQLTNIFTLMMEEERTYRENQEEAEQAIQGVKELSKKKKKEKIKAKEISKSRALNSKDEEEVAPASSPNLNKAQIIQTLKGQKSIIKIFFQNPAPHEQISFKDFSNLMMKIKEIMEVLGQSASNEARGSSHYQARVKTNLTVLQDAIKVADNQLAADGSTTLGTTVVRGHGKRKPKLTAEEVTSVRNNILSPLGVTPELFDKSDEE